MLDRLLKVDPGNHEIWTVYDPSRTEFIPMAASSGWRDLGNPDEAEISATVLDRDHGHALMENRSAAQWMRRTGATGTWDGDKNVYRWDLSDLEKIPETRAAAELAGWLAELSPKLLEG